MPNETSKLNPTPYELQKSQVYLYRQLLTAGQQNKQEAKQNIFLALTVVLSKSVITS